VSSETRRQLEAEYDLENLEEDARQVAVDRAADPGPTRDAWNHVKRDVRTILAEDDEED
jgi:hypothetical protein